jgi:hypothetical protein
MVLMPGGNELEELLPEQYHRVMMATPTAQGFDWPVLGGGRAANARASAIPPQDP